MTNATTYKPRPRPIPTTLLACLATLSFASTALAADTAVFAVQATNLSEAEGRAIGTLVAAAYAEVSGKAVLMPAQSAAAVAEAGLDLWTAALTLGVEEYIVVTAVRLDSRVSIFVTLYDHHGRLFSHQMTAESLDDVEPVSHRLAHSLHRRASDEYPSALDDAATMHGATSERPFVEKIIGFRVGVLSAIAAGNVVEPALITQFDMRLEADAYFIELGAGIMLPSDINSTPSASIGGVVADLGASYYLGSSSVSPYIGAGLSPRIVGGSHSGTALTAWGQAGLMFMRESSSRLYVELRLGQNLLPLRAVTRYSYDDSGETQDDDPIFPTELTLAAGLGW